MIIDCNAFTGNWPFGELPFTLPVELADAASAAGISRSLISPLEAMFHHTPHSVNMNMLERTRDFHTLSPVPVINPEMADYADNIKQYLEEYSIIAVRIAPEYQSLKADSPAIREFLELLQEIGLPLIIQIRMEDTRCQHPAFLVPDCPLEPWMKLLAAFPGIPVLFAGIKMNELAANREAFTSNNFFTDTSWFDGVNCIEQAINAIGNTKVIFGSNAPLFYMQSNILKLERADISEPDAAAIASGNASAIFRIYTDLRSESK